MCLIKQWPPGGRKRKVKPGFHVLSRQMKENGAGEERETVNMTSTVIALWVGMCCVLLVLLYNFYNYLGMDLCVCFNLFNTESKAPLML